MRRNRHASRICRYRLQAGPERDAFGSPAGQHSIPLGSEVASRLCRNPGPETRSDFYGRNPPAPVPVLRFSSSFTVPLFFVPLPPANNASTAHGEFPRLNLLSTKSAPGKFMQKFCSLNRAGTGQRKPVSMPGDRGRGSLEAL